MQGFNSSNNLLNESLHMLRNGTPFYVAEPRFRGVGEGVGVKPLYRNACHLYIPRVPTGDSLVWYILIGRAVRSSLRSFYWVLLRRCLIYHSTSEEDPVKGLERRSGCWPGGECPLVTHMRVSYVRFDITCPPSRDRWTVIIEACRDTHCDLRVKQSILFFCERRGFSFKEWI